MTADQYAERLAVTQVQADEVKKWLADHAIHLKSVEASQGFDDMQPLKQLIGEARLVSLGEAKHGTREFFQLKHRMLEFLVRAIRVALAYVSRVDAELPASAREALSSTANPFLTRSYDALPPEKKRAVTSAPRELLDLFDPRKADHIKRTSADEWAIAQQHARVLSQNALSGHSG
jgi:erythromycin esterase-like protein